MSHVSEKAKKLNASPEKEADVTQTKTEPQIVKHEGPTTTTTTTNVSNDPPISTSTAISTSTPQKRTTKPLPKPPSKTGNDTKIFEQEKTNTDDSNAVSKEKALCNELRGELGLPEFHPGKSEPPLTRKKNLRLVRRW